MSLVKKIIIIDNDDRNIFALYEVLKAKGYQCVAAISAKEGLKKMEEQNDIGIALIDMMMPEMDGYQMVKKIRVTPALRELPLIAVTAQAMVGDREKCLGAGADDYISKPVNIDALVKILQKYLNEQFQLS